MNEAFGHRGSRQAPWPRLAVVTVCLDDLGGLLATYESLRLQTAAPQQWIVADGGSTDGTCKWLRTVGWSLLSWSSEPDGGIFFGMNRALRSVDADYVLFLNSGDVLSTPDVLQAVGEFIRNSPSQPPLVYGDSYEVDVSGTSYLRRARPPFWVRVGMPTTHQAMFFRTDAIASGFDTRHVLSGDYDVVARLYLAQRGRDFGYLARPLCRFKLGGRSEKQLSRLLREHTEIRRRVLAMGVIPAEMLCVLHTLHGIVKRRLPALHRLVRYG